MQAERRDRGEERGLHEGVGGLVRSLEGLVPPRRGAGRAGRLVRSGGLACGVGGPARGRLGDKVPAEEVVCLRRVDERGEANENGSACSCYPCVGKIALPYRVGGVRAAPRSGRLG